MTPSLQLHPTVWTVGLLIFTVAVGGASGPPSLSLRGACAQEGLCLCPSLQGSVSTGLQVWGRLSWCVCGDCTLSSGLIWTSLCFWVAECSLVLAEGFMGLSLLESVVLGLCAGSVGICIPSHLPNEFFHKGN